MAHLSGEDTSEPLLIRNEFAAAQVWIDQTANGPRLFIRDLDTGAEIVLDALEVACLTLLTEQDLNALVTPL